MSGITELGYVRFGVSDLQAWRNMAGDLLGAEVVDDDEPGLGPGQPDRVDERLGAEDLRYRVPA